MTEFLYGVKECRVCQLNNLTIANSSHIAHILAMTKIKQTCCDRLFCVYLSNAT